MTFDEWWSDFWDPLSGPAVTNLMFKEIAQSAWEAAKQEFENQTPATISTKCTNRFQPIPRLMEMPE